MALMLFVATTRATAQTGADSCATPDAIAGQGLFPFDQTGATTGVEGQNEPLCAAFTGSSVDSDVWFAWTADANGTAFVQTCNQTSVDTKIAAYPGNSCPVDGSALDCNDDSCGLQSKIGFPCTNGTVYLLRVGTFQGVTPGLGALDINISSPIATDDCNAPAALFGQGSFAFDNGSATTGTEGQGEVLCYAYGTSGIDNDLWISWAPGTTGMATVSTCSTFIDPKIAAYPGSSCPAAGTALDCNDDTCGLGSVIQFPVTAGTTYTLQVGSFPGAIGGFGLLDTDVEGSPQAGTAFCFCPPGVRPAATPAAAPAAAATPSTSMARA